MLFFTLQLPPPRTVIPREKPVGKGFHFAECKFYAVFKSLFNRIGLFSKYLYCSVNRLTVLFVLYHIMVFSCGI